MLIGVPFTLYRVNALQNIRAPHRGGDTKNRLCTVWCLFKPMGLIGFTFWGRNLIKPTPAFSFFPCSDRDDFLYVCLWGPVMGIGGKKTRKKRLFIMSPCRGYKAMTWGEEEAAGEACCKPRLPRTHRRRLQIPEKISLIGLFSA
jgi:hypothetical protein